MVKELKAVRMLDKLLNIIVVGLLSILLLYGIFAIWDIYVQQMRGRTNEEIMHLKPGEPDYSFDALLAINPDVVAWLTIDGTNIDNPVLQGEDNAVYLENDIYKRYYVGGSIFLDYRNDKTFADSYCLIHGHHMDGGAMFGDLGNFKEEVYYNSHGTGTLYTPDNRYKLEIFAYMDADAYDYMIYEPEDKSLEGQQVMLDYIREQALYYTDIGIMPEDKILAMSTCSSAFTNSRSVVIAKMVEVGKNENGVTKELEAK